MPLDGPLNPAEKEKAEAIFDALDEDGDGRISHDDLKTLFTDAGFRLSDDDIDGILALADAAGTGYVTKQEFFKVLENRPIRNRIAAAVRVLFNAFDTDGSGYITFNNLKGLIKEAGFADQVTDAELYDIISRCDDKGDGKISFEEFLSIFMEV